MLQFSARPRLWRRLSAFLGLFSLCFTLIVACNPTPDSTSETPNTSGAVTGDRVVYGTTLAPRTIDPADSYETAGVSLIYNLSDTLFTYEPGTTELVPQLATEMPTISEDGLIYTVTVREDVTFHDGEPFNAEAMKFSLDRFIQNGGKPSFLLADAIASIAVTGDYELTFTLKQPFAAFPALLAYPGACAVSPAAYEIGAGQFNPDTFVGTGPYTLAEFGSDTIRLEVNPDYWGEKPQNEGVDIQIYKDNSANLFNAFRTGAVDMAYQTLDPDQITTLRESAEQGENQALEAPGTAVNYLVLNLKQEPVDQLEVRQAIAHLVDRQLISDRVFQDQAEPLYSLIPTALENYYVPALQEAYPEADSEGAMALLEAAGYTPENPATVQIWYPSSSTTRGLVAQTLQALAESELGGALIFEPQTIEGASFFKNIQEGTYPSALVNWYPDFLDADNFIQPLLSCTEGSEAAGCVNGASQNQGAFYYSERMNELIAAQREETDPAVRQEIFAEIQQLLAADLPYIPLWQTKEYLFVQNGIEGVKMNPSQLVAFAIVEK